MPELPEVENVVRFLKSKILGKLIINAEIIYPKLLKDIEPELFIENIKNKQIIDVRRYGKFIIFDLGEIMLINHLRMEGKWYFEKDSNDSFDQKHLELIIFFDDNSLIKYIDTRKFGTMHIRSKELYLETPPLIKVSPDPFLETINIKEIAKKIQKSHKNIKTILLDQSVISGLGNIYVNEVLFDCKINPTQKGFQITTEDIENIIQSSREIFTKSIELGGSTISSFHSGNGTEGKFQDMLKVHNRKNLPCLNCGNLIQKEKVNGRGTYFCPNCQVFKN